MGDLHPGAYSDYTGYATANTPDAIRDPDRWQPLNEEGSGKPSAQAFYMPHWGRVKPSGFESVLDVRRQTIPKSLRNDPAGLPTPPFSDFVSSHSAITRSAAEVLKRFTQSDRFGYSQTRPPVFQDLGANRGRRMMLCSLGTRSLWLLTNPACLGVTPDFTFEIWKVVHWAGKVAAPSWNEAQEYIAGAKKVKLEAAHITTKETDIAGW